ncbi:hypothetical protein ES708_13321 [subsurface metagenome]
MVTNAELAIQVKDLKAKVAGLLLTIAALEKGIKAEPVKVDGRMVRCTWFAAPDGAGIKCAWLGRADYYPTHLAERIGTPIKAIKRKPKRR